MCNNIKSGMNEFVIGEALNKLLRKEKMKTEGRRLKDVHRWVGERCVVRRSQTGRTGG